MHQQQQINPKYWCKFEAFDSISLAIIAVMFVVQSLLLSLYVYSLKIRRNNNIYMSTSESFLFKIINVWFIIIYAKFIINICDYVIFVSDQSQINNRSQIILSAVLLFLDRMSSFTLHTILIKIPCIWIKNITMKLQNKELTFAQMKRADLIFKVLDVMDKYFTIRLVIILINLAFNIYFSIQPNFGEYAGYLTIITMAEATVAISIYTFGIFTLKMFQDLFSIPKKIRKMIITQYTLLMVCCLCRLIFNTVFYLIPWHTNYYPLKNCKQGNPNDNIMSYFYISIVFFLIHIVPVLTIILVYWPQTKKIQNQEQSLINSYTSDMNYSGTQPIKVLSNNYLLGSNKRPTRYFESLSHEAQDSKNIQGLGKSVFK